ncbi:MAG: D-alanyl-D-alanine carboxypeptidase/D-alanyl-D-alanine-endopeptidase [Pseudomonadota bacterium]
MAAGTAQAQELPAPLRDALAQSGIPAKQVGIWVQEASAEQPLAALNADTPLNPASTMKLLTTYAALDMFGPAFVWKTEAYALGKLNGDVLEGDLALKGYGDPKLTLESFWLLLRELRARGVREITGDLVLDRSYFNLPQQDPAAFDNEPLRPYNVAPDALMVNFKAIKLTFLAQDGSVNILADPHPVQLAIVNNVLADNASCGDWTQRITFQFQDEGGAPRLLVGGNYSTACGEQVRHVSVLPLPQYVYGVFRQLWRELGGSLNDGVREGTVPEGARLLVSRDSMPLAEIVRDVNKFSNNVMARELFINLALADGAPLDLAKAVAAVKKWLAQKNLVFPELVLENGAGLSRSERISARHLGELLASAYRSRVMPEYIASLPLAAEDGTMKKRLNGSSVAGQAHVKTGSLEGVRAVAGYVQDVNGRMVVVVCLVNHPGADAAQGLQDAVLQWAYRRP